MKNLTIAIDGPSGAGKSTVAKGLAERLGLSYIDTGAMYRALALGADKAGVDFTDGSEVEKFLSEAKLSFQGANIFLNGKDVTKEIRQEGVSRLASNFSKLDAVRTRLVSLQQELAQKGNVVMEGRDIGTVVLPQADLKFFLTASEEIRGRRRAEQMREKGMKVEDKKILEDIRRRDFEDMNREHSPLRKAQDAITVDNSRLTLEETVELLASYGEKL